MENAEQGKGGAPKKYVTGPTFIGINAARAQYLNIRWQIVTVVLGLNSLAGPAIFALMLNVYPVKPPANLVLLMMLSLAMVAINRFGSSSFRRTNQMVEYFTQKLINLENDSNDLYPVYSDKDFPGQDGVEPRGQRISKDAVEIMLHLMLLWFSLFIATLIRLMYLGTVWYFKKTPVPPEILTVFMQ